MMLKWVSVAMMILSHWVPSQMLAAQGKETPVLEMTRRENLEELPRVIRGGANLDAFNQRGETALHLASDKGNLELVKILVAAGAEVDKKDRYGWTPCMIAAGNGFFPVVRYLHGHGANLNAAEAKGITGLMWASVGNHVNVIKYLIRNGAELNARDQRGRTALDSIKFSSYRNTIRLLRQLGAKEGSFYQDGSAIAGSSLEKRHNAALGIEDEDSTNDRHEDCPSSSYHDSGMAPEVRRAYDMAYTHRRAGRIEETIQYLIEADSLSGGACEPCLKQLIYSYIGSKEYEKANSALTRYRDVPTDPYHLAEAYWRMGDAFQRILPREQRHLERTEKYYLEALEVSQGDFHEVFSSLARFYSEVKRPKKGVALLETLLAKEPRERLAESARTELAVLKIQAGAELGELPIRSLDGGNLNLPSYRDKVVLIDIWATWCAPCKASQPAKKRLGKKAGKAPFVLLGISGDSNLDMVKGYVAKNKMDWPQFIDPYLKTSRKVFDPHGYPTYILIDHKGQVIYRKSGWSAVVNKMLELQVRKAIRKAKRAAKQKNKP